MAHAARRHRALTASLVLAVAGALGACTSGPPTASAPSAPPGSRPPSQSGTTTAQPSVDLTSSVDQGSRVPVDTVVSVAASNGTVSDVELSYRDPKKGDVNVEGSLDPSGAKWVASSLLEPGTTYSLTMTGKNPQGTETTKHSTFSTQDLSKKQQIFPQIIADGATVGVAMPVIVHFDVPVKDKAAFEKRMTVTSSPQQDGSWNWISSNEAHWRPVNFWQPGTTVAVNVDVNSVPGGNGTFGQVSVKGGFTVGRSVVVRADLAADKMTVEIGGAVVKTIPITGGKAGFETRSGTKVIMEKFPSLHMDANTIGIEPSDPNYYNIPDVKYALRETYSGEFLHAAPWSVTSQGHRNVSHGCIGMSDPDAGWLFTNVKVGDPVVVTGTNRGLEAGNGWTDWNVSFDTYQKGSALAG
jgi:lipoprotein-anchoring transpeptidase ErfK/SrfK